MKKIKFDTYNDGVLEHGLLDETYDEMGNAANEKEFIFKGKLFFSIQSIRFEDRQKYDTEESKISMKLRTIISDKIRPNQVVNIDNSFYSIIHIDRDYKNNRMFIFITDLKDTFDKHIDIYSIVNNGPLANDSLELLKVVWGNVSSNISEGIEVNKIITIRYIDNLTTLNKIIYKDTRYSISKIINVDDDNKLLEIVAEAYRWD